MNKRYLFERRGLGTSPFEKQRNDYANVDMEELLDIFGQMGGVSAVDNSEFTSLNPLQPQAGQLPQTPMQEMYEELRGIFPAKHIEMTTIPKPSPLATENGIRQNPVEFLKKPMPEWMTNIGKEVKEETPPPPKQRNSTFDRFLMSPQAQASSWETSDSARTLGYSFGFNPNVLQNPEYRKQAKTGRTLSMISGIGDVLLGTTRDMLSGYTNAKRDSEAINNYYENLRKNTYQTLAEGGVANPIVEVEDGEYLLYGNQVEQVEGKKHSEGGEIMALPENTEVVTDQTKVGKSFAKVIKDNFDMKVKATDTYADVIDKYTKQLKIKEVEKEIDDISEKLGEQEKIKDGATKALNTTFLQGKLQEATDKYTALHQELSNFSKAVYEQQEANKRSSEISKNEYGLGGKIIDMSEVDNVAKQYGTTREDVLEVINNYKASFADGGEVREVNPDKERLRRLARIHGQSPKQFAEYVLANKDRFAQETIDNAYVYLNKVEQFEEGGETKSKERKLDYDFILQNERFLENYGYQKRQQNSPYVYGDIDENESLSYYDKYLKPVAEGLYKQDENGKFRVVSPEAVLAFQKNYNSYLDESRKALLNLGYSEAVVDEAVGKMKFIEEDASTETTGSRKPDSLYGNITGSRAAFQHKIVTPSELEALHKEGIYTSKDFVENYEKASKLVDVKKAETIKNSMEGVTKGFYAIGSVPVEEEKPKPKPEPQKPTKAKEEKKEEKPNVVNNEVDTSFTRGLTAATSNPYIHLSRQRFVPPTPHIGESLFIPKLGRMSAPEITDEEAQKAMFAAQNFATSQAMSMPGSQANATLAQINANTQGEINKSAAATRAANVGMQSQVEQFNIGQMDREDALTNAAKMDYEGRTLLGAEITAENWANYENAIEMARLSRERDRRTWNLINQLSNQYAVDSQGNVIMPQKGNLSNALFHINRNPMVSLPSDSGKKRSNKKKTDK